MVNFEEIFDEQELAIFESISAEATNVNELKKTGNVLITSEESADGYITETITYKSFDGTVSFTRFNSYLKVDAKTERIKQLNELIDCCVRIEKYEDAMCYKNERDSII